MSVLPNPDYKKCPCCQNLSALKQIKIIIDILSGYKKYLTDRLSGYKKYLTDILSGYIMYLIDILSGSTVLVTFVLLILTIS